MQHRSATRWLTRLLVALLAVVVLVLFLPTVRFDFINYDEIQHVIDNPHVRSLSPQNLWHVFTHRTYRSYYPVRVLSCAIDYAFWGLDPAGYHLTNVLLHLTNVLLLFGLCLRLAPPPPGEGRMTDHHLPRVAVFLGAALFAVHPVVVEPVAWVSGREELLMVLFALACVHLHVSARAAGRRRTRDPRSGRGRVWILHGLAAIACVFACMSNAVAAIIPALVVAYDLVIERARSVRQIVAGSGLLWLVAVGPVVLKKGGYDINPPGDTTRTLIQMTAGERVLTVLMTYALNLKTLIWPRGLALIYPNQLARSILVPGVLAGLVLAATTLLVLWRLRRRPAALFGALWFLLALAPSSQVMPHHIFRADRFMYLPLAGLALAVAAGMHPLLQTRPMTALALTLSVLGLGAFGVRSWFQTQEWRDAVTVFSRCIRLSPADPRPYNLRAVTYAARGEYDLAIEDLNQAIRLAPDDPGYYFNRAKACASYGRLEQAIADYGKTIRYRKDEADAYNNRGSAYLDLDEYELALADFSKAIALRPEDPVAHYNRGNAYTRQGKHEEAIADYTEAIRLQHDYADAYNNRGTAYLELGQRDLALADFDKALVLSPEHAKTHHNLGAAYARRRQYDLAIPCFDRAIALNPGDAQAYSSRGRAWAAKGEHRRAVQDFTEVIRLTPGEPASYLDRGNAYVALEQLDEAIEDYTKVLELAPANAAIYNRRGVAYGRKNDLDRAILDFDKAIGIAPRDAAGYANRALVHYHRGSLDQARRDWERVVELDPDGPTGRHARQNLQSLSQPGP